MYFSFPINEESRIYKQLEYFHLLVEFIFISDFILTFFQAFQHKETYEIITDYKKIAINYVNGWFNRTDTYAAVVPDRVVDTRYGVGPAPL